MSLSEPSDVSATTGSDQSKWNPLCTSHSITASRTTPTEWVLVIITGPARNPDSSSQVVPVISPLPFRVNHPAMTGSPLVAPRGSTAVTPVRTGPCPTTSGPLPDTIVTCPTVTPATSVMALSGPGVPSNGTPRSRERGFVAGGAWPDARHGRAKAAKTRMALGLTRTPCDGYEWSFRRWRRPSPPDRPNRPDTGDRSSVLCAAARGWYRFPV